MARFIEIHQNDFPVLVNLDWVEEIRDEVTGGATIYFAFTNPNCDEQDHFRADESFEVIKRLIDGGIFINQEWR